MTFRDVATLTKKHEPQALSGVVNGILDMVAVSALISIWLDPG